MVLIALAFSKFREQLAFLESHPTLGTSRLGPHWWMRQWFLRGICRLINDCFIHDYPGSGGIESLMPMCPYRADLGLLALWDCCIVEKLISIPRKYTKSIPKKILKTYPNIFKYIQDISKISKMYKINTRYQAAAGPAQAKGRAEYLILWIYLDIFRYVLYLFGILCGISSVYFPGTGS